MKKIISVLAASTILICAASLTVSAHGHHGNKAKRTTQTKAISYIVCEFENCVAEGFHKHDGIRYCSTDEYNSYDVCSVAGCTELGLHMHDDVYYRCDAVNKRIGRHHHR